jgi:hypothetical protein
MCDLHPGNAAAKSWLALGRTSNMTCFILRWSASKMSLIIDDALWLRASLMYANRRRARLRISDNSVIWDVTMETCDLHVFVLWVSASYMRLSHLVACCSKGSGRHTELTCIKCATLGTHKMTHQPTAWIPTTTALLLLPELVRTFTALEVSCLSLITLGFGQKGRSYAELATGPIRHASV